jgi:hypothetical protein
MFSLLFLSFGCSFTRVFNGFEFWKGLLSGFVAKRLNYGTLAKERLHRLASTSLAALCLPHYVVSTPELQWQGIIEHVKKSRGKAAFKLIPCYYFFTTFFTTFLQPQHYFYYFSNKTKNTHEQRPYTYDRI